MRQYFYFDVLSEEESGRTNLPRYVYGYVPPLHSIYLEQ